MKALVRVMAVVLLVAAAAGWIFYRYPLWVNDEHIRLNLWRSNVRSEYIEAGGYRLHYFEAMPPDGSAGTPLLLLHGLGSRAEDWSPMIPQLAASGFHVYAPDLLGYGRSAKPDVAYSISLEEGSMVDFMRAVGIERADLGGWSMGGWIALKTALDHPERVDRLVVYDSVGTTFQPSFARDAFVPTDIAGVNRLFALLTPKPPVLPGFVARATLRKIARYSKIVQKSVDSMVAGGDLLDARLGGIRQPTLIMWGTEDRLIPMAVGEAMHQDIPKSVFEGVVGCGHLAPGECPRPVLSGTIEFLRAQPAMAGGTKMLPGTAQGGETGAGEAAR